MQRTESNRNLIKNIMDEYENIKNNNVDLKEIKKFYENAAKIQIVYIQKLISALKKFEESKSNQYKTFREKKAYEDSYSSKKIQTVLNKWEEIQSDSNKFRDEYEMMHAVNNMIVMQDQNLIDLKEAIDRKEISDITEDKIRKELDELIKEKEKKVFEELISEEKITVNIERKPRVTRLTPETISLLQEMKKFNDKPDTTDESKKSLAKLAGELRSKQIDVNDARNAFSKIIEDDEIQKRIQKLNQAYNDLDIIVKQVNQLTTKELKEIFNKYYDISKDVLKEEYRIYPENDQEVMPYHLMLEKFNEARTTLREKNILDNKITEAIGKTIQKQNNNKVDYPSNENSPTKNIEDSPVKKKEKKPLSTFLAKTKKLTKNINITKNIKAIFKKREHSERDLNTITTDFYNLNKETQTQIKKLNTFFTELPSAIDNLTEDSKIPKTERVFESNVYYNIAEMRSLLNDCKQLQKKVTAINPKIKKFLKNLIREEESAIQLMENRFELMIKSHKRAREKVLVRKFEDKVNSLSDKINFLKVSASVDNKAMLDSYKSNLTSLTSLYKQKKGVVGTNLQILISNLYIIENEIEPNINQIESGIQKIPKTVPEAVMPNNKIDDQPKDSVFHYELGINQSEIDKYNMDIEIMTVLVDETIKMYGSLNSSFNKSSELLEELHTLMNSKSYDQVDNKLVELKKEYLSILEDKLKDAKLEADVVKGFDEVEAYENAYYYFRGLANGLGDDPFSLDMNDMLNKFSSDHENKFHDESPEIISKNDQDKLHQHEESLHAEIKTRLQHIASVTEDDIDKQFAKLNKWENFKNEHDAHHQEKAFRLNHIMNHYDKELKLHKEFINAYKEKQKIYTKFAITYLKKINDDDRFLSNPENKNQIFKLFQVADNLSDNTDGFRKDLEQLLELKGILMGIQVHTLDRVDKEKTKHLLKYISDLWPKVERVYEIMAYCYHPQYVQTAEEYHALLKESLKYLNDETVNLRLRNQGARPHKQSMDATLYEKIALSRGLFPKNHSDKNVIRKEKREDEDEGKKQSGKPSN